MNVYINDLLIQIKNGLLKYKHTIIVPYSSNGIMLLKELRKNGLIRGFSVSSKKKRKVIEVLLKYTRDKYPSISELTIVSKIEKRV